MIITPCNRTVSQKRNWAFSVVTIAGLLAFIGGFQLLGAAVTYGVSLDKTLVKGGSTQSYTFTVINGTSDNPIYNIKITKPTGFTVSASGIICPTNFGVNTDNLVASGFIECLGDPDPSFNARLLGGATGTVTLSATAPTSDSTAPWVVVTKDTAFASRSTNLVSEVDATTPTVTASTLITPNGGFLKGGASYEITWSGITDTHLIATPITLEYSALGDFSDTVIITEGQANEGFYGWTVPTADLATAKVRITAVDSVGNSASDVSDSAFVVDSTAPSVNAGADVLTKIEVTQNATVTDTNAVTYQWEQISTHPGTVTFGTPTAEDTTMSADQDGIYAVRLNATDASGNSAYDDIQFVWDTTAPTVTLTKDHADLVVRDADTVGIIATFNEAMTSAPSITIGNIVTAQVMTVGSNNTVWTYSWDVPSANDGDVVASVAGTDLATNAYAGGTTLTFTIDNTAPNAPVVSSPAGAVSVNADTYTISGTAEANALVKVYSGTTVVGSQQLSNGATSYSVSATLTANTAHTFTVTATDTAGNEGLSSTVPAITEDSIAPEITTYIVSNTVISPTVSSGTQDSISIDIAFSETSDYTIKIKQGATLIKTLQDSRALNPNAVVWDGTNNDSAQVSEGTYIIEIIAEDDANNKTTDTSRTITVDNTAPTFGTLVPSDASYTNDSMPLISATLADGSGSGINADSIEMTVDGEPVTPDGFVDGVVSFTPDSLTDGSHTVTVDVEDNGGTAFIQAEWSFTVDTIYPTIAITAVTTPTAIATQTITGTFTEINVLIITVNGVSATIGSGTYSVSIPLVEGNNPVAAVITDFAGNTANAGAEIVLDTIDPTVNAGADVRAKVEATLNGTADGTGTTITSYQWTKQAGTGTITFGSPNLASTTIASDTNGTFTIRLTATDAAENSNFDDVTFIWDTVRPTVVLTDDQSDDSVRDADTVVITATFSEAMAATPIVYIDSADGLTTFVDGAAMAGAGTTWTYSWDVPGDVNEDVEITVDGQDLAGNLYAVVDDLPYTIDNTPPIASEVTPVTTPTNDATPDVVINVEDGAAWAIKLDSTTLASGTGTDENQTATLSALIAGSYTLNLIATDTAGNGISVPLTLFIIDITSPTITARTPGVGASGVSPSANISATFSEDVTIVAGNVSFDPTVSGTPVVTFDAETNIATIDPATDLVNNATYTITLTGVTDLAGNALGTMSWQFNTSTGYSVMLTKSDGNGWNFISLPTIPVSTAIADVLGSAASNIESVWTYNTATDSWSAYYPAEPGVSTLSTMTAGYGYWIKYTGSSSTTLTGSGSLLSSGGSAPSVPPSRSLPAGWNLIGYYQAPGTTSVSKSTAFQSLNGVYTNVLGFDNTNKGYVLNSNISTVNPGQAFWILLQSSGVYSF